MILSFIYHSLSFEILKLKYYQIESSNVFNLTGLRPENLNLLNSFKKNEMKLISNMYKLIINDSTFYSSKEGENWSDYYEYVNKN